MPAYIRIPLVHPDVDGTAYALSVPQARILRKAGWVDAPPVAETDEAEQGDPLGVVTTADTSTPPVRGAGVDVDPTPEHQED